MKQFVENKQIEEGCHIYTHRSGLRVYVIEKPDYSSSYAIFGTRYGSIDTSFRIKGSEQYTTVPEGIAHFLEHKLFESEDGDAFARYSKTGAAANAFTSFDRTCYLFSCSSRFEDNFRILLDFVQHPYFTQQTVDKEQGIIGQEINMMDDSPSWRVLVGLLGALYHNHPVRIEIAGTVESIAKIDEKLLYECYNTFYNLNNMYICVAGNVKAQQVFDICDELLADTAPVEIERAPIDEPREVVSRQVTTTLPVAQPMFAIGYKEACEQPQKNVMQRVSTELLLKMIFGSDSPLYKSLFDEGLINNTFNYEYFCGHDFATVIIEGESDQPQQVYERINAELARVRAEGLDEAAFNRAKRAFYGSEVEKYNSVENAVMSMVDSAFLNEGVFDTIDCVKSVSFADVCARLDCILEPKYSAISVVHG